MDATLPQPAGDHRHLQQIIAGLTEGVILIEPDQTLCWANEAALAMHGAKALADLGRHVREYRTRFRLSYRNKHPVAEGDSPIERAVAGDTFDAVVVEVTPANQPDRHWMHETRSLVLTTPSHEPELFVLVIEDVTERFDAEDRFERTFNANPAPAVICRLADLRYVKVNRGFLEMTGFSSHDVIGRSVYEIDVLADAERRELAITCLREGRTIEQQEACIATAASGRKFVIVAGQPIELADQASMLFTFIDLQPRKRIEDALRQSEQRFATAFRLAPVPMAVTSLDGFVFLDVNEAFAKMTGYPQLELLGRSTADVELWESSAARAELHRLFDRAGSVRSYEIKLRTRALDLLDCVVSSERVTILDMPCVLHVVQDITDRKRSETELFTAIESVMKDTSWFSQKVIEKVADLRQPHGPSLDDRAGLDSLTDREREVLGLLCTGLADAQIAERLGVSRNTIRNHVSAIYDKIGVNRRATAIVWARERGMAEASASGTKSAARRKRN